MFFTSKFFLGKCSHFIPRVSLPRFLFSPFSNIINKDPPVAEPDSFVERDKAELQVYFSEKYVHWKYKKIRDGWQKPLEKKRLRRERKALEAKPVSEPEAQKLVVHNPAAGIETPPKPLEVFAVLEIAGFQFKVVTDDQVICEHLKGYDINDHIVFDKVLLVGTKDYTSIGRPFVETAKVYATVEEQCLSEKVIVFKKRRRKHYKRTAGAKQRLTVIRIDRIEHGLDEKVMSKAVALC